MVTCRAKLKVLLTRGFGKDEVYDVVVLSGDFDTRDIPGFPLLGVGIGVIVNLYRRTHWK